MCFLVLDRKFKIKMHERVPGKKTLKKANSWIQARHLWLPNHRDSQTYVLIKAQTVLLCKMRNLRVMSKIRKKKKTLTTGLNIFLWNRFFDGK